MSKPRLFITKNPEDITSLKEELGNHFDITAHSFLQFKGISFKVKREYDVVFFSSPRSVHYFFQTEQLSKNCLIACAGTKTAHEIRTLGYPVDFVDDEGEGINKAAEKFKEWCAEKKVLFPVSSISLMTFSSLFLDSQKEVVQVYETSIHEHTAGHADIIAFSSPSNVKGYFLTNTLSSNSSSIIAWGNSTKRELEDYGLEVSHTLSEPSLECLIVLLKSHYIK